MVPPPENDFSASREYGTLSHAAGNGELATGLLAALAGEKTRRLDEKLRRGWTSRYDGGS
jgi:hypothetical protein